MPRRPPKAWMDRCLLSVSKDPDVDDPGAICGHTWYHTMSASDRAKVVAKESQGEVDLFDEKLLEKIMKEGNKTFYMRTGTTDYGEYFPGNSWKFTLPEWQANSIPFLKSVFYLAEKPSDIKRLSQQFKSEDDVVKAAEKEGFSLDGWEWDETESPDLVIFNSDISFGVIGTDKDEVEAKFTELKLQGTEDEEGYEESKKVAMKEDKEVVDLKGATKKVLDNMVKSFEQMRDAGKDKMMTQDKYVSYIMKGVKEESRISDYDLAIAGMPAPMVVEMIDLEEQPVAATTATYKTVYLQKKDGSTQQVPFQEVVTKITPFSKNFESPTAAIVMGDPDAILKVLQHLYGDDVVSWQVPAEEDIQLPVLSALALVELYNVVKFDKESNLFEKWEDDVEVKSTGEHAKKTVAQLRKEIANIKKTMKPGAKRASELQQRYFAIKSKTGKWTGKMAASTQLPGIRLKEGAVDALVDAFDKADKQYVLDLFPNVLPEYPEALVQETKTVLNLLTPDEMARLWPNINPEYLINLKEDQLEELVAKLDEMCGKPHGKKKAKKKEQPKSEGKDTPGKRDGTGPYKGSYRGKKGLPGRRKAAGEPCPMSKKKED